MSLMGRALGTQAPFVAASQIDEVLSDKQVLLLDVRTALELAEAGTIPGAVHIHLGELATGWRNVAGSTDPDHLNGGATSRACRGHFGKRRLRGRWFQRPQAVHGRPGVPAARLTHI